MADDVYCYRLNGKEVSPSTIASDWQGRNGGPYYSVDKYVDKIFPKGTRFVQLTFEGAPQLFQYFMPLKAH